MEKNKNLAPIFKKLKEMGLIKYDKEKLLAAHPGNLLIENIVKLIEGE